MYNVVTCSACKTVNTISNRSTQSKVCKRCSKIINLKGEVLGEKGILSIPKRNIEIGGSLNINSTNYRVSGYAIFNGYEDNDGESWYWEEYYLISGSQILYLEFDQYDNVYAVYKKVDETIQNDRFGVGYNIKSSGGKKFKVDEKYTGQIIHADGEFPYELETKKEYTIVEGEANGFKYTVEIDDGSKEFFEGEVIGIPGLENQSNGNKLGIRSNIQNTSLHNGGDVGTDKGLGCFSLILANFAWFLFVFFVFCLVGVFGSLFFGDDTYYKKVDLCAQDVGDILDDSWDNQSFSYTITGSCMSSTDMPVGPIKMDKEGRVYEVELNSFTRYSTDEIYVEVEYLDQNERVISKKTGTIDGLTYALRDKFVLSEARDVYMNISLEDKDGQKESLSFQINVKEGIVLKRYFVISAVVSIVTGICAFVLFLWLNKLKL